MPMFSRTSDAQSPARLALKRLVLPVAALALFAGATTSATAGRVQLVKSPGGIEAWLIESHEVPMIDIAVAFKGGDLQDRPGKAGTAMATAYMFNEGGGNLTSEQFIAARDEIGVSLGADAYAEYVQVNFRTVSEYKDKAFDLLSLSFGSPRFDQPAFDRGSRELIGSLENALSDPSSIGSARLMKDLFAGHRLAIQGADKLAEFRTVVLDDVKDYRRRIFARDNMKIGVAGDITAAELGPLLDKLFAGMPAKAELLPEATPARGLPLRQVVDQPIPQSVVAFGSLTEAASEREWLAMALADDILNASFTGPLWMEVREKRGLVYYVGTATAKNRLAYFYSGSFGSANETVGDALSVTLGVLKKFAETGPTQEQINAAKAAAKGGYFFRFESGESLVGGLVYQQLDNRPIDSIDTYVDRINSVTIEEVRAAAKKMIRVDDFSVVVVGKPVADINNVKAGG